MIVGGGAVEVPVGRRVGLGATVTGATAEGVEVAGSVGAGLARVVSSIPWQAAKTRA